MPGLWVMASAPIFVILLPTTWGFVLWEIVFTVGEVSGVCVCCVRVMCACVCVRVVCA